MELRTTGSGTTYQHGSPLTPFISAPFPLRSGPQVPAHEEEDVEQDGQPEVDLKGAIAPLVTKDPLSRQRPRPAAAEGEEVQGAFSDALAATPGHDRRRRR